MARALSITLGLGLLALWFLGLQLRATAWLVWLDAAAALASFAMAALVGTRPGVGGVPGVIAVLLVVLGVVGLASSSTTWLSLWTLAFACAYGLFALVTLGSQASSGETTRL